MNANNILLVLLIVGVVLAMFPVDPTIRKIIIAIVVILAVIFLFTLVGGGPIVIGR